MKSLRFITSKSTERPINRRTLRRERLRTLFGYVHAVFESDTELAIDGYHRFVAKAHPGLKRRLVAAHQVSPLMAVQPDAVSGAMRQARNLVIRTEAGIGDHLASRRVDGFTG